MGVCSMSLNDCAIVGSSLCIFFVRELLQLIGLLKVEFKKIKLTKILIYCVIYIVQMSMRKQ